MNTSRFYLPLILIVSILLTSCDKEPYSRCKDDPDCEYFRCKVNGKWWTPDCEQGSLFGCTHTDLQYYYKTSGTVEFISKSDKRNEGIKMIISSVFNTDSIYNQYSGPNNVTSGFRKTNNIKGCELYYLIEKETSKFLLRKIDSSFFLIEGEFSFKVMNECEEILNISDGEFHQHYRF